MSFEDFLKNNLNAKAVNVNEEEALALLSFLSGLEKKSAEKKSNNDIKDNAEFKLVIKRDETTSAVMVFENKEAMLRTRYRFINEGPKKSGMILVERIFNRGTETYLDVFVNVKDALAVAFYPKHEA